MVSAATYNQAALKTQVSRKASAKIRIFVDAHCFDTSFQGTQSFIRELYRELLSYEELNIYFGAYYTHRLQKLFPSLPPSHFISYRSPGSLRRLLFDIPAILKKHHFDFAHFQNITPLRLHGTQSIVTLHDILYTEKNLGYSTWFRWIRNKAFGSSIRQADIRTTVSEFSRRSIATQYNLSTTSIHVLPNATGFGQRHFNRDEAAAFIKKQYGIENFILNVSRVEPRKNQGLLLDAFMELELYKEGWSLVFIGKDSITDKSFKSKLKKYSSICNIQWHEQVDQKDLESFYSAARLFVYPSAAEGFGIPPLEAACCLTPVLCSEKTAMSDFDFFHPYCFDPANKNALHELLINMIACPPSQDTLQKISEVIRDRYDVKTTAGHFMKLIREKSAQ